MPSYFKENQKFTQIWLWVLLLISTVPTLGVLTYGFIRQLILNIPWGDTPMSDSGLAIATVFVWAICGGVLWLFAASELQLEIKDQAIYYRFPLFSPRLKRIGLDTLESWKVRKYGFFEYGGYGVRHAPKKRTGFIVNGKIGLELKLKNGKTVMIGTQKPEEVKAAMQNEWDKFKRVD
jgi:hypothetical protein